MIDFSRIERKWQRRWEKEKAFVVKDSVKGKKNYYVLEMYPYPSAQGLHMGHALNYTIGDIFARYKRMNGLNVLYPMGFDSFGLPAENAAIKAKSHPKKFTEDAIKNYIKQMKELGLSYDWTRIVKSHNPEYYKWDQWIFLKMFEKGLAYKKKAGVNYCKKCKTVLANEQVVNGRCWRHEDQEVEIKQLEQWFLKTTEYAEELIQGLDKLQDWPELIKTSQRNWIGKSKGTEVDFLINGKKWGVFTTRPDTLFGVTFLVVSSGHPDLMNLVTDEQKDEVLGFLKKIKSTKEEDALEKEGVFTGSYANHPLTDEEIPIWTGNFVVADYGCGMVMADAHDQRDLEFAQKYKIPLIEVIVPENGKRSNPNKADKAFTGHGTLVNSSGFDGLKSREAIEHITNALIMKKFGRRKVAYRLRDWLISRQRFWGTPIPIIYCDKCGIQAVKEKDLPVKLPNVKFGKGNSLKNDGFVNVKCPKCAGPGKRETDTMDTFVNSSWYFLRYTDAGNNKKIFDKKKARNWMPIDLYIGGKEHACLHLIYFRFYTKFLRDLGLIKVDEPAKRLFNQGMLHGIDGRKMSKSYGNVIVPEKVSEKYGIDTARLFLVSVAGPDKDINWNEEGIEGSLRFMLRVVDYFSSWKSGKSSKRVEHYLNKAIVEIAEDIENMKYNLAVIKLRELFGIFEKEKVGKEDLKSFVKILSVFCPHVSEELWFGLKGKGFVSLADWPKVNKKKINDKLEEADKALEKVVSDIVKIKELAKVDNPKLYIYVIPGEVELYVNNRDWIKESSCAISVEVYAVNDNKKYDPQGKSKKVKPGRPGIFVE